LPDDGVVGVVGIIVVFLNLKPKGVIFVSRFYCSQSRYSSGGREYEEQEGEELGRNKERGRNLKKENHHGTRLEHSGCRATKHVRIIA